MSNIREEILRQLNTKVALGRASPGYHVMLVLTTMAMIMLPVFYLGLIAVVGYGLIWHIVNDYNLFSGITSDKMAFLVFFAPLIVGTEGDCFVDAETADKMLENYRSLVKQGYDPSSGAYHVDIPCTWERERDLLQQIGFSDVKKTWSAGKYSILVGHKI